MHLFTDQDSRIERIWCDEKTGVKLRAEHTPSGIVVERIIGFDDESRHRRELLADLSHRVSKQYPPESFIIEHMRCGPGKGAALRLCHTPTGVFVERVVGYEPQAQHLREMVAELFRKLRENGPPQNR